MVLAAMAAGMPAMAMAAVDDCGSGTPLLWPAGGSICVDDGVYVEALKWFGFYEPDMPLPVVGPGAMPGNACGPVYEPWFGPPVMDVMEDAVDAMPAGMTGDRMMRSGAASAAGSGAAPDHSTTNIQEYGVDEPDIVKNTAASIYVAGDRLNILDAWPPRDAGTAGHSYVTGKMLLHGDMLAVFERGGDTKITILDVSDKSNPQTVHRALITGAMHEARLVNGTIYVVTHDFPDRTPSATYGNRTVQPATHYFPHYGADRQTVVAAVGFDGMGDVVSFLTPYDTTVYSSGHSLYLALPGLGDFARHMAWPACAADTKIVRLGLSGPDISYGGDGTVPGFPIDQFAMSEKDDTFRTATTTWSGVNSAYKLDRSMDIVGKVVDIAPGETMHSARFHGDTLYLVTFRQVDPFFVIDFAGDPRVLGELKLPGFSEYLHPYDEDTILGVGRETVGGEWGPVLDGVKVTVFDVSDPADPTLADFTVIGDRTAYSSVQGDHKAALVSERAISIPVSYDGATSFHVYEIADQALVKQGVVHHPQSPWARSLYMGDYLYTITPTELKITDLDGFVLVNSVPLD